MNLSSPRDHLFRAKAHIASALELLEEKPKGKHKWVLLDKQYIHVPIYRTSSKSYATMEEAISEIEPFGLFKVMGRLEE